MTTREQTVEDQAGEHQAPPGPLPTSLEGADESTSTPQSPGAEQTHTFGRVFPVDMDGVEHVVQVVSVDDGQSAKVHIGPKAQQGRLKPLRRKLEKQDEFEKKKRGQQNQPVISTLTHTLALVNRVEGSSSAGEWDPITAAIAQDLRTLGRDHHIRMLGKAPAPTDDMVKELRRRTQQRTSEEAGAEPAEDSTTRLGNAFHDKPEGGARDPTKDAFLDQDVTLRLQALGLERVAENDAGLDFKHWMVEGEMPPPYLEPLHKTFERMDEGYQRAFLTKARKMRSAAAITRSLTEQYEQFLLHATSDQRRQIDDEHRARATLSGWPLNEENLSDSRIQLIEARTERLEKAGMKLEALMSCDAQLIRQRIEKWVDGGKKATLAAVGDAMWEVCSLNVRGEGSSELNGQIQDAKRTVGEVLMSYGRELAQSIDDNEKSLKTANESGDVGRARAIEPILQEAKTKAGLFAFMGQAWSEATSALGEDVYGEVITDSYSAVVADYFAEHEVVDRGTGQTKKSTGQQMVGEKMRQDRNTQGKNGWCDMDIPGSMWSRSANLDRYRDTHVHLFAGTGGAEVSRENADHDLRVTHSEIQVGSTFDASDALGQGVGLERAFQLSDETKLPAPASASADVHVVRVLQNGNKLFSNGTVQDPSGRVVPPSESPLRPRRGG